MKTNKNGVKLLAAIAVFAMVAAALVVALPASDAGVAPTDKYVKTRDGPLNFADVGEIMKDGEAFDNITLGNQIEVAYDASSMTYIVTGILAKQDVSSSATSAFKALWADNTEYLYGLAFSFNQDEAASASIKVGNGDVKEVTGKEGCLLYIKETKISTFTIVGGNQDKTDAVYSIDFNGVTLVDDAKNNPTTKYVNIPNSNALIGNTEGIDGNGGKWSIDANGVLTLTNYNGKEYFSGDINMVVLEGKNAITLTNAPHAIQTKNALTIKSIDGVGSLSINMDSKKDAAAISSGKLTITGVGIDITMTERYDANVEEKDWLNTIGIESAGLDIYAASLTIDVAKDNYYKAYGINSSAGVDIKSTPVKIAAGERGMNVGGNISIADSDVEIEADLLGIRAHAAGASISITKESNITLAVNGLKGGYDRAYGLSASGKIEVQSDSVLETEGMILYGNGGAESKISINNATIINNGEMIVWKGATFQNAGKFVNNKVVGIYGYFINSAGETTNNGMMNTYAQDRTKTEASLSAQDSSVKPVTLTITIDGIMPLADGSFLANMNVSTDSDAKGKPCVGTITYTANGYTIDALTETGVLTVSYDKDATEGSKYVIFSSDYTFTNSGDAKSDDIMGLVNFNSGAYISVSGGQLTNDGSMTINTKCDKLVNGGKLINNKELTINADITTEKGTLSGEEASVAAKVQIKLAGTVDMAFTHSGTYTPAGTGTQTPVSFTDAVSVVGKVKDLIINTTVNPNMNGFIAITGMKQAGTDGKAVVTILQGSASFEGDIETDMVLSVASGATLQILNGGAKAIAGVVAIQDGATINMKITSDRNTFKFGELQYTISFQNDGYTYYGSLQYALANAAEGATLNLNGEAKITTDTVVKKGIVLIFADKATLTVEGATDKKIAFSMEEGAKFVFGKDSAVKFNQYATVSGTIVYDVNEIVLDKVILDSEDYVDYASIVGKAAGASTPSFINVTIDAIDGKIDATKGTVQGTVTIHNVMDNAKLKTTAKLTVSEGVVAEITFDDNEYAETVINGTLKLSAPTGVDGKLAGAGSVVLKDGTTITFNEKASASIIVGNGTDALILDKATGSTFDKDGKYVSGVKFNIISVAKTGTKDAYVAIYGEVVSGTITSQGNTAFGAADKIFTVGSKATAVVPKDATLTIVKVGDDNKNGKQNTANGLLKVAGTINMKVADDSTTSTYGTLNYQITYADGDYTVYTMLATGVGNASAGDEFTITSDLTLNKSMDIPAGVTIVIAENSKIIVPENKYIAIGSPITTVGATSSIQGTISLGANAFVIVYADDTVDMSKAKILASDGKTAKNSQFTVLNEVYATVYVDITNCTYLADKTLGNVKEVLVPAIDGFRFLGWNALVKETTIGETDYDANMKADMVKVVFQKVDGISYYVDNVKQNTLGAPIYVAYGATVTAVADAGYTGNALVNGKSYITIDNNTNTIVGSGVSPAVDPTPEPEKKDDGMGLTDILLIVLVILAAILVIVVAIRMMRS